MVYNYSNEVFIINKIIEEMNDFEIETITRKKIVYPVNDIYDVKYIPNNYVGQTIRGNSIFDAWYQTLDHVYKYGCDMMEGLHEYHSIHWNFPVINMDEDIEKYRIIISQSNVQKLIGIDKGILDDYVKLMMDSKYIENTAYTYGNRLACYKDRIVKYLKKSCYSRHAFGTTLKYDVDDKQAPCLVYIQLLYDNVNNKMNMYAVFRSHDIFKASF